MEVEFGVMGDHAWINVYDGNDFRVIHLYGSPVNRMDIYGDGLNRNQIKKILNQLVDEAEMVEL